MVRFCFTIILHGHIFFRLSSNRLLDVFEIFFTTSAIMQTSFDFPTLPPYAPVSPEYSPLTPLGKSFNFTLTLHSFLARFFSQLEVDHTFLQFDVMINKRSLDTNYTNLLIKNPPLSPTYAPTTPAICTLDEISPPLCEWNPRTPPSPPKISSPPRTRIKEKEVALEVQEKTLKRKADDFEGEYIKIARRESELRRERGG